VAGSHHADLHGAVARLTLVPGGVDQLAMPTLARATTEDEVVELVVGCTLRCPRAVGHDHGQQAVKHGQILVDDVDITRLAAQFVAYPLAEADERLRQQRVALDAPGAGLGDNRFDEPLPGGELGLNRRYRGGGFVHHLSPRDVEHFHAPFTRHLLIGAGIFTIQPSC
jgi:hypothetical protein